jgi:SulP family sulfate permease
MKSLGSTLTVQTRFSTWLADELRPDTLLKSAASAVLMYVLEIIVVLSFAALIFSGGLASQLPYALGFIIAGDAVLCAVVALVSSYPGTIAIEQDAPSAILAVVAAAIVAALPAGSSTAKQFSTVVWMIVGTTLLSGMSFILLGRLKLGGLVRFLPYPVMGGFLAGTGWLLASGGVGVMADTSVGPDLFLPSALLRWLPGLILGAGILLASNRFKSPLVLPGTFVGGVISFHLISWLIRMPLDRLGAEGWLLGPFPSGSLWRFAVTPESLSQANWPVLISQIPNLAPVALISIIALLLNVSALELVVRQDIDPNRELVAAGLGNMVAGLLGGLPGYHAISLSTLNHNLGGSKRLPGLFMALLIGLTVFVGASVLNFVPKMILGALLLYVGVSLLVEWVYLAWFKFPRVDFLIILLILGVIAARGFLEGIGVGLVLTIIIFVVNYSRISVVKHALSGRDYRSRVSRSRREQEILDAHGDQIYILKLQGFIFFGTANNLFEQIRERLLRTGPVPLRYAVLDFEQVIGLDSTGLLSFSKMLQLVQEKRGILIITGASGRVRLQFEKGGLPEQPGVLQFSPDLDHGIERCENEIIAATRIEPEGEKRLQDHLEEMLPTAENTGKLIRHLEKRGIATGEYLICQGDEPDFIFFVESGRLTAQLEAPGQEPVRLETTRGGRSVGEIGYYLGIKRTASVVANEPSVVYSMSKQDLERIEKTDPEAASLLHRVVVHVLGERVVHLTRVVDALER